MEYSDASFTVDPVHEERGLAFDIFPSSNHVTVCIPICGCGPTSIAASPGGNSIGPK